MLGLTLFDRSTRGTEPTAAGGSIVRFARGVLAEYERTRDQIAAEESGAAGRTRVGSMVVSLPTVIGPAVQMLKDRAPQATVLVDEGDLTQLLPKLRIGELDLFVGCLEPGYASPDLVTEALYKEAMVAVSRPDHPLALKARVSWSDLLAHPCVLPPPWASLRVKLEQQFFKHGLHPPGDLVETASFLAQLVALHERRAIAFMAVSVARHFQELGIVQSLRLKLPIDLPSVGMITVRGQQLTTTTLEFMACVRKVAAKVTSGPRR